MSRVAARTPLIAVAIVLGLLGVLVFGMYAYDHAHRNQLATGVTVDGISRRAASAPRPPPRACSMVSPPRWNSPCWSATARTPGSSPRARPVCRSTSRRPSQARCRQAAKARSSRVPGAGCWAVK